MRKQFLQRSWAMSAASTAYVVEAAEWAKQIVRSEARFPGDYGPAMKRAARKVGVPFGLIWRLHYRAPNKIDVSDYAALGLFIDEQRKRFRGQRNDVQAHTAVGRALLGFADRLAGEESAHLRHAGGDNDGHSHRPAVAGEI